jgi:glycerophosphoryl diester phosphodiesterase
MPDIFRTYMKKIPEIEFHDQPISEFSLEALRPFMDGDGAISRSLDLTVKGCASFEEVSVISTSAFYTSENGELPMVQMHIIDGSGHRIYYSPIYEIGSKIDYCRREWRLPPLYDRYDTVRFSFIIPEGVKLYIRTAKVKSNYCYRERDIGIRYHGHGGCTTAFGMMLTAELGFTSCITIPKFTKDGVGVCVHDDTTVIDELLFDDGTKAEVGSEWDKPVSEYTYEELLKLCPWRDRSSVFAGMRVPTLDEYFHICSTTGMQPIFSVHPDLTKEQWQEVRRLLIKHNLLEHFWVKSSSIQNNKACLEVFGDEIAGYILIFGMKRQHLDVDEIVAATGFDKAKTKLVVEYFEMFTDDEIIKRALSQGYPVSLACMRGGISGPRMKELIDLGVTEFTVDRHCSMGLSW